MALTMTNLDQRETLVCSADPDVTLKFLPAPELTDEEKAAGKTPPTPVREPRSPIRWLKLDEVDCVAPTACRVTVRILDRDEQFACTGGLGELDEARLNLAHHRALGLAATGFRNGTHVAGTQAEVAAAMKKLPLRWAGPLGQWLIDESCGFNDPFVSTGSV